MVCVWGGGGDKENGKWSFPARSTFISVGKREEREIVKMAT